MKCGRPKPKGEQAAGAEGGSAGGREGLRGRQLSPLAGASVNAAEQSGLWGPFFKKIYMYIYNRKNHGRARSEIAVAI